MENNVLVYFYIFCLSKKPRYIEYSDIADDFNRIQDIGAHIVLIMCVLIVLILIPLTFINVKKFLDPAYKKIIDQIEKEAIKEEEETKDYKQEIFEFIYQVLLFFCIFYFLYYYEI